MRRPAARGLTAKQRLDLQTAVFLTVDVCITKANSAKAADERQAWDDQATRYIDAYQAVFGSVAADRYRARLADASRGNSEVLAVWPPRAPRHAPTSPRLDRAVRRHGRRMLFLRVRGHD